MKRAKYEDLEDMVYRMELPFDDFVDILDKIYSAESTIGYTLPPGIYKISEFSWKLMSSLPRDVKVNITIDDIRLRSNLIENMTIKFTKKSFFSIQKSVLPNGIQVLRTILHQDSFKEFRDHSKAGNRLTSKIRLECDCNIGSIVNGSR